MRPSAVTIGMWLVVLGILIGVVPTGVAMVRSFNQAARDGEVDLILIEEGVSFGMSTTVVALPIIVLGVVVIAVGTMRRSRPPGGER